MSEIIQFPSNNIEEDGIIVEEVDRFSPEKVAKGLREMFTKREIARIAKELENDGQDS